MKVVFTSAKLASSGISWMAWRRVSSITTISKSANFPSQPAAEVGRTRNAARVSAATADRREGKVDAFSGEQDRHNAMLVDVGRLQINNHNEFTTRLAASIEEWTIEQRSAAWLRIPIEMSAFIAEAATLGFRFHHAEDKTAMLFLWLRSGDCKIHPFATHQIGVAGCIVNSDSSKVLVVRDKGQRHPSWKFPGGVSDLGENIDDTAKREIFEETGLRTEFGGVLAFRQHHYFPGAFGRSDLYFVCHMTPLTFDINICPTEVASCQWIDPDELIESEQTAALTKHVAVLARLGLQRGFEYVNITCAVRQSIFRDRQFNMYSRQLSGVEARAADKYLHDSVDSAP